MERQGPTESDWSFAKIFGESPTRATELERAGSPDALVPELAHALAAAINTDDVRFAVDSLNNAFKEVRVIVQFRVTPSLFDWFFNSRTGYRAHYWRGTNEGLAFNTFLVRRLTEILRSRISSSQAARRIKLVSVGQSREERDCGPFELPPRLLEESLSSHLSKIWICERLIQHGSRNPRPIGGLASAAWMAKLVIPRWATAQHPDTGERGEGCRAPCPEAGEAWIDLKGAFVGRGDAKQPKAPERRADDIWHRGWT
jgi:hypothetical protein